MTCVAQLLSHEVVITVDTFVLYTNDGKRVPEGRAHALVFTSQDLIEFVE